MKKINESGQSMVLALVFLTVLMGMAAMAQRQLTDSAPPPETA